METKSDLYKKGFISGIWKGLSGFLWVVKILLPINLIISLGEWSGLIYNLEFIFKPVMPWLGLPPMAALPLIFGLLSGIYAGLAAMVALPFTKEQMTLLAIFMMLAHSLPQEGIIQGKSGFHPLKATLIRLSTGVITLFVLAPIFDSPLQIPAPFNFNPSLSPPFSHFLQNWLLSNLTLSLKILAIISSLSIFLEICRTVGWVEYIIKLIFPLLKVFGLSSKSGIVWITGTIFGLIYGATIILEEIKEGNLQQDELEKLQISIGLQHSVLEDPFLFLALGLNAFWLWVPRFLITIGVVRLYGLAKEVLKKSSFNLKSSV